MKMFENAGKKIRLLAKITFWTGSALSAFAGLSIFFQFADANFASAFLIGIVLVAGVGILLSYLGSLATLSYGELVEHTTRNMMISAKIYEKLCSMNVSNGGVGGANGYTETQNAVPPFPAQQNQQPQSNNAPKPAGVNTNEWFCMSCGTRNSPWSVTCSNCGKNKNGQSVH